MEHYTACVTNIHHKTMKPKEVITEDLVSLQAGSLKRSDKTKSKGECGRERTLYCVLQI